jgi:hypothetical protein
MNAEALRNDGPDGDVCAVRALAALSRISDAGKRTREDWRAYGDQLLTKRRALKGDDKAFGKWVKANGLDCGPAKRAYDRADAIWLAEFWQQISDFYISTGANVENINHPRRLRQACRKAGCEWAVSIPSRAGSPVKLTRAKRELSEVAEEAKTLPESARAKLERLAEKERKALDARFSIEVETAVKAQVEERVALQKKFYIEKLEKTNELNATLAARLKTLDAWMTEAEFKTVLGCLHPDRQPEDQREKYGKAFQIFKRLEEHLNPDARARKTNHWSA